MIYVLEEDVTKRPVRDRWASLFRPGHDTLPNRSQPGASRAGLARYFHGRAVQTLIFVQLGAVQGHRNAPRTAGDESILSMHRP